MCKSHLLSSTLGGNISLTRIRRDGFVFISWASDHQPRHVHVYRDGRLVVKWDLERDRAMAGAASHSVRAMLEDLKREGLL